MARSYDLLPEPPKAGVAPIANPCACGKTPPSIYDTLESGEVKHILGSTVSFFPQFFRAVRTKIVSAAFCVGYAARRFTHPTIGTKELTYYGIR
jgi:hypothetical protein